ncbi:xylose isomerase-like protein [Clavulina sp. PMI_390]|nr:xylose isomerase-like protein [Clavulina sp. PMI_390]
MGSVPSSISSIGAIASQVLQSWVPALDSRPSQRTTTNSSSSKPTPSLGRPKFAIASLSLGSNVYHTLPKKIEVAAEQGYDGIEIFIADFEAFIQEVGAGAHSELFGRFPAPAASTTAPTSIWSSWFQWNKTPESPSGQEALEIRCAQVIGDLCASLNLSIPVLQPFRDFENFFPPPSPSHSTSSTLTDEQMDAERREDTTILDAALSRADRWFKLMRHMRTDLILVNSNPLASDASPLRFEHIRASASSAPMAFEDKVSADAALPPSPPLSSCSSDAGADAEPSHSLDSPPSSSSSSSSYSTPYNWPSTSEYYKRDLVFAFTRLADLAAKYDMRVSYEALAWGTMVNRWEQVAEVVREVNRDNFGMVLDSFNQLAKIHADPSTPSGLRLPSPSATTSTNLTQLTTTLSKLPPSKLFLYQIASALPPPTKSMNNPSGGPLHNSDHGGKKGPKRMRWSRSCRVFPGESEFLPVEEMTKGVMRGLVRGDEGREREWGNEDCWWSLEVFNDSLADEREGVVKAHAKRGMVSLRGLWDECGNLPSA